VTGWNRQAVAESLLLHVSNFVPNLPSAPGWASTPFWPTPSQQANNGSSQFRFVLRIGCTVAGKYQRRARKSFCSRQCQGDTLIQFADESHWTRVRTIIRSWRITKPWISSARRSTAGASHDFDYSRAVSLKAGSLPVEESDIRSHLRFAPPALFKRTCGELGERASEGSC
jgi:hypothetical protein